MLTDCMEAGGDRGISHHRRRIRELEDDDHLPAHAEETARARAARHAPCERGGYTIRCSELTDAAGNGVVSIFFLARVEVGLATTCPSPLSNTSAA